MLNPLSSFSSSSQVYDVMKFRLSFKKNGCLNNSCFYGRFLEKNSIQLKLLHLKFKFCFKFHVSIILNSITEQCKPMAKKKDRHLGDVFARESYKIHFDYHL